MAENNTVLLEVKHLYKSYPMYSNGLWPQKEKIHAVEDVSFQIMEGETLGLVGESGSGKSTSGRLIVGLEKADKGEILYKGENILEMSRKDFRAIRREIQMVFQDPNSSLNPRKLVRNTIADPMLAHRLITKKEVQKEVSRLLDLVGLPSNSMARYPHEFSGGQRQRLGIARALGLRPKLLVLDEPVSALDVSIQAQILNLLSDLQEEFQLTYLFIAHGLGAVHYISDRIAVMDEGKIVEIQDADTIFQNPQSAYTKALIKADPIPDPSLEQFSKGEFL